MRQQSHPTLQTLPCRVDLVLNCIMTQHLLCAEQQPHTTGLNGWAEGRRRACITAGRGGGTSAEGSKEAEQQQLTERESNTQVRQGCGIRAAAAVIGSLLLPRPAGCPQHHLRQGTQGSKLGCNRLPNPPTAYKISTVPHLTACARVSLHQSPTAAKCSAPAGGCCSLKLLPARHLCGDR